MANLKTTLNNIVQTQNSTIDILSSNYYNKDLIDNKVKPLTELTDDVLSGFSSRLSELESMLDSMDGPSTNI
jgi:hypothetical protein